MTSDTIQSRDMFYSEINLEVSKDQNLLENTDVIAAFILVTKVSHKDGVSKLVL